MDAETIAREVQERIRAAACPDNRAGMEGYFTTGMQFLGVKTPALRAVVKETAASVRKMAGEAVLETAMRLAASGVFEDRQAGYELVSRHKGAFALLDRQRLEALGEGNDNWASVDTLACLLAGPCWLRGMLSDETIMGWATSPDLWWRRTGVVCTTTLNKKSHGGKGDPGRTLPVLEKVLAERHPMIVKAVSWALRELVPWAPETVALFIEEHDSVLAPLVRREVRNKLTTGLKNPR